MCSVHFDINAKTVSELISAVVLNSNIREMHVYTHYTLCFIISKATEILVMHFFFQNTPPHPSVLLLLAAMRAWQADDACTHLDRPWAVAMEEFNQF